MGVKKGQEKSSGFKPESVIGLKSYTTYGGETVYHDPEHARCRGTGFLVEHILTVTEEGERWTSQALDCSCRPTMMLDENKVPRPVKGRLRFDEERPIHAGMSQDDLDRERDRALGLDSIEDQRKGVRYMRSVWKPDSSIRRQLEAWVERSGIMRDAD